MGPRRKVDRSRKRIQLRSPMKWSKRGKKDESEESEVDEHLPDSDALADEDDECNEDIMESPEESEDEDDESDQEAAMPPRKMAAARATKKKAAKLKRSPAPTKIAAKVSRLKDSSNNEISSDDSDKGDDNKFKNRDDDDNDDNEQSSEDEDYEPPAYDFTRNKKRQERSDRQPRKNKTADEKRRSRKATRKSFKQSYDEEESTEEEIGNRKPPARRSPRCKKPERVYKDLSNSEGSDHEEEDEYLVQRKRLSRLRTPTRPSTNDNAVLDDSDIQGNRKPSSHANVRRKKSYNGPEKSGQGESPDFTGVSRRKSSAKSDDSGSEEEDHNRSRSSPERRSVRKANRRMSELKEDEDDDAEFLPKQSCKKSADEEEFAASEEESDGSDDDDVSDQGEPESEDDIRQNLNESKNRAVGTVNDTDIGIADDSSGDDDQQRFPSPELKLRRNHPDVHDADTSDEGSISPTKHGTPQSVCKCSSEEDVITGESLPQKHICFFSPDGQSRQCFALETLRKIALSAGRPHFDKNGNKTFLQPPHFRSPMSDDLLDQIASRFGREACDLNGAYYKRDEILQNSIFSAVDEPDPYFQEQLNTYLRNIMGSRDLYCCPLCYIVAHNKAAPSKRKLKAKEKPADRYVTQKFALDPMEVLGSLDRHQFKIASMFCFRKAAQVKEHLRDEHGVKTNIIKGNDLYARFQVRAQDGLLQRWVMDFLGEGSLQGHLLSYWFGGNNYDFVHLLELVEAAEGVRDLAQTENPTRSMKEKVKDAKRYVKNAEDFFKSFDRDANALWERITGPYQMDDSADLDGFIADEENDDGDDDDDDRNGEISAMAVYREVERKAQEEEMRLDQEKFDRYRQLDEEIGDEADSNGELHDGEDVEAEDDVKYTGLVESSEEDEDEWVTQRSSRKRGRKKQGSAFKKLNSHKKLRRTHSDSSESVNFDANNIVSEKKATPSTKRRMAIQDSDDNE